MDQINRKTYSTDLNDTEWAVILPVLPVTTTAAPALHRLDLRDDPRQGVYIFYEDNKAIYMGRSDNLKPYLMSQGQPGSNNFTAPIAFGFAKQEAIAASYPFATNAEALHDPTFTRHFDKEKARVAAMRIRVIEVKDPIEKWLLVIYGSMELRTSNHFETT